MNIVFIMRDEALERSLKLQAWKNGEKLCFFDDVDHFAQYGQQGEWDVMVLSDRFFDFDGFCAFVEQVLTQSPPVPELVVLLSNRHDHRETRKFLKYCASRSIRFVHPGRSLSGVVSDIVSLIGGGNSGHDSAKRIVAFVGSTPNIGTTVVSYGAAYRLALTTGKKIGYFCLNLKSSKIHRYLGVDEPVHTLDSIRGELKAKNLTSKRLEWFCHRSKSIPNLSILFGNLLREQAEYYTPEDMDCLLEAARSAFDLAIIEVNAYWDNAATVCGLLAADTRILVTTDELGHFQEDVFRWFKNMSPLLGMDDFDLFITQKSGGNTVNTKDIRRETGLEIVGEMPKLPHIAAYLNEGRLEELFAGEDPAGKALNGLVLMIQNVYGLKPVQPPAKKGMLARLLAGTPFS